MIAFSIMQDTKSSHVIFEKIQAKHGHIGLITLNRPESLNALSEKMTIDISEKLHSWAYDSNILAVIIQSSNQKAFSAGGDVKQLYITGRGNAKQDTTFFRYEYKLNEFIHKYPKPYIALLDGIAMGGGLGLSVHGSHVVAAENLKLAMPETGIGLFPDVGASYFLSHCPNYLGMYLGLTGSIVGFMDAIFCRLVDFYVPREKFSDLIELLTSIDLSLDPKSAITEAISSLSIVSVGSKLQDNLNTIETCFSKASVDAVISALEAVNTPWALEQIAIMQTRSPTSLKITHKAITMGATMDIAACLEMEFNLITQVVKHHDIYEGIRAVLIDKTHDPKWKPSRLQDVSDSFIDDMFEIKCKL